MVALESHGVVAKCHLGIRRCLWPYGKYTGPEGRERRIHKIEREREKESMSNGGRTEVGESGRNREGQKREEIGTGTRVHICRSP